MTKKFMVAAGLLVITSSMHASAFPLFHRNSAKETVTTSSVSSETTSDGKLKVSLPPRQSRRRMLVDFGLLGMGVHVGWLKPKTAPSADLADAPQYQGHGNPIFNVSAGTHALGIGTNAYK